MRHQPFTHPASRKHDDYSFSPVLGALTSAAESHLSRPTTSAQLLTPPKLSARADPSSEEARLLGPMIPQRIQAVKRRYWHEQTGKVRPPLAVRISAPSNVRLADTLKAAQIGTLNLGRGVELLRELEGKARVPESDRPKPPRRLQTAEQRAAKSSSPRTDRVMARDDSALRISIPSRNPSKWHLPKTLSPRHLRRRFQEVLTRTPILKVVDHAGKQEKPGQSTTDTPRKQSKLSKSRFEFKVSRSDARLDGLDRVPEAGAETMWHLQQLSSPKKTVHGRKGVTVDTPEK